MTSLLAQSSGLDRRAAYAVAGMRRCRQLPGPPVYSGGYADGLLAGSRCSRSGSQHGVLAECRRRSRDPAPVRRAWASMAVAPAPQPVAWPADRRAVRQRSTQLYYFFPLTPSRRASRSMQRTLLLVGLALVFLLAAIAWLVTRWVVVPVRLAAQGASGCRPASWTSGWRCAAPTSSPRWRPRSTRWPRACRRRCSELEDLSQVQRQFVSDVSHELRTPLTTIRMASDVLFASRDELDPGAGAVGRAAAEPAGAVRVAADRPAGDQPVRRQRGDAGRRAGRHVRRRAAVGRRGAAAGRAARHEDRVPAARRAVHRRGGPAPGRADPAQPAGQRGRARRGPGHRGHRRRRTRRAVAVAVRDYGVGLRPGEEQLVFDRFWRADPARARTTGGTGLGLAIALEDARLHGGWLEAWGEPGRGLGVPADAAARGGRGAARVAAAAEPDPPTERCESRRTIDAAELDGPGHGPAVPADGRPTSRAAPDPAAEPGRSVGQAAATPAMRSRRQRGRRPWLAPAGPGTRQRDGRPGGDPLSLSSWLAARRCRPAARRRR